MRRLVPYFVGLSLALACLNTAALGTKRSISRSPSASAIGEISLSDFGSIGDGVADDGPAFQRALDALAAAGGGTLFVPEGKYLIKTPVTKKFTGLASSITIRGVESSTVVPPPTAGGDDLSKGLDLPTEIYPHTGTAQNAFTIEGLSNLVVKDIAFIGDPSVMTDAVVTLMMADIDKAQVKHSEFYGLATFADGGAIVKALRSDLEITQCKFLGSTATSGGYLPLVENLEWRGVTVTDTIFIDYGQRPFFGKTGLGASIAWINIGNAAPPTNRSPRRQVVLKNVFLDEGSFFGFSSLPYRYTPASAPIDLIYVTGLYMNVSNFFQVGHELYDAQRVFIEKSTYGWSQNATAAIALRNVGTAILDQLTCVAHADHIFADENTKELTVINSTFAQLDSFAQTTNTITTAPADDPVQYVRARFAAALGREPDAAAHFYWSELLIHCSADSACQTSVKAALNAYLANQPSATFAISGRVIDEQSAPVAGVTVTLSGSQSVATTTDNNGDYVFTNLPTSGNYTVTPAKINYTFDSANQTFVTPSGDRTANFKATRTVRSINGSIKVGGNPLPGVTVAISGSATATATTDSAGEYSLELTIGGNYVLTPTSAHYTFDPGSSSINDLRTDVRKDFTGTIKKHSISGHVLNASGEPVSGAVLTLSGSVSRTTTSASDGSYSFADIDGGSNCTVTASHGDDPLWPLSQTFSDLSADSVADFQVVTAPTLLVDAGSGRALALELTTLVKEPFSLTTTLLSEGRNRTRLMFFSTNLGLLAGEGVEALTAEAEDSSHTVFPLRVETVTALPELPGVTQIVLRLNGDLPPGDVLVSIKVHGLTSNKVHIAIEP